MSFIRFIFSLLFSEYYKKIFFLVPKPQLGNASAPEAPASGRLPSREAGASPASAFPSWGLGTRNKFKCVTPNITKKYFSYLADRGDFIKKNSRNIAGYLESSEELFHH
jgi:hypothetical protein